MMDPTPLLQMLQQGGWPAVLAAVALVALAVRAYIQHRENEALRREREALHRAADGVDWQMRQLARIARERTPEMPEKSLEVPPVPPTPKPTTTADVVQRLAAAEEEGLAEIQRQSGQSRAALNYPSTPPPTVLGVKVPPR